jgi:arginyl-tRNA synthetase
VRLERQLDAIARDAIQAVLGESAPALVRPANPEHGDYQVNGILPLAKQLKKPPRSLGGSRSPRGPAARIASRARPSPGRASST